MSEGLIPISINFLMARVESCLSNAEDQSNMDAMIADPLFLSNSPSIWSMSLISKCSVPVPTWLPNCDLSILGFMSSIIYSLIIRLLIFCTPLYLHYFCHILFPTYITITRYSTLLILLFVEKPHISTENISFWTLTWH